MNSTMTSVMILLFSPVAIIMVHAVVARTVKRVSAQIIAIVSAALASFAMAMILWNCAWKPHDLAVSETAATVLYALIVYASIAYAYFHLFNMSETARRIRILHEIYKGGSLSAEDILSIYEASDIIEVRLERLFLAKQLARVGKNYVVKGRVLYYAALIIEAWRSLLGFEAIERKTTGA